ncbi:uncharacterized protein EV154DRAFT_472890 [Mucor mucedo]|uniref:uncharacterized protein n=1 Tax=Mucor mucedo TaxID=29922 RepID=UPI00221E4743|nr:uncharacterized protein EV154DRAFT_472890 [Mucor mucedo]KAI7875092.1 hypothetical protein EV154DRAFT_472890 [Mucor mucedo]
MSKGHYVCQRAAHAIIAEFGPIRVSSDALSAINLFLDEFLALLIMSASTLDLVLLKTAVVQLLPHSLGKNSLVEAEIELKHQIEAEQHDFTTYEKMRHTVYPPEQIIPLLQLACTDYCTLAAENHSSNAPHLQNDTITIAPVVVIYVTAIVEHIAEYILNSVAIAADQADAEHIRVKEVLLALLDDPQVNKLFRRMSLKEKLEKRASTYNNQYLPTPSPSPISFKRDTSTHHNPDISFNEFLEGESTEETRATPSSNCSMRSSDSISDRPLSIMSNGTVKSSGSKSRFNFFGNKEKRNSISLSFSSSKRSPMTSPTAPTFQTSVNDFDDLIRSGNTKKVSLTPNRLRSIEIKDDVTPWERFSTSNPKISQKSKKRATSPPPPLPPLPRLTRGDSPPLTPASSVASRPSQKSRHSIIYEDKPPTKSSIRSYSTHEELLVDETTNLMRNSSRMSTSGSLYSNHSRMSNTSGGSSSKEEKTKPRFERPSSMVVKRASMGSRPPSFHENVLMDVNGNILMAAAAGSVETTSKTFEDLRQQYEKRNPPIVPKINEEQQDMIYVMPSIPSRPQMSGNHHRNQKPRTVDRGCQTDIIPLHALTLEEQDEDEEWFIEEEEWEDHAEEEKFVAEWLLGNE